MSETSKSLPNLFEYDNYRKYLKDAQAAMKAIDSKFSDRYFARVAGFNSHSFLRLVIQGKSNLSHDSIEKISKVFKFNVEETRFFRNLVLMNQAVTSDEKQAHAKEILRSRTFRKIHPLEESKFHMFANWYVTAVRELVALPKSKSDPAWIAEQMIPPVKVQEAKKAIEELLKLGLLKKDENGKLVQSEALLTTPVEVSSAFVAGWHKEYLKRAGESIDSVPREKRDISAVSFGFPIKNIKVIKDMVAAFRKEILQVASQQQDPKDSLLQLNIQLFPLAEIDDDDGEK